MKRNSKTTKILVISLIIVASLVLVMPVSASTFSYGFSNSDAYSAIKYAHPSSQANPSMVGESFRTTAAMKINSLTVYLFDKNSNGASNQIIKARIYGMTDFLHVNTTDILSESTNSLNTTTIVDGATQADALPYTFNFDGTYELQINTNYYICIYAVSVTSGDTYIAIDTSSPSFYGYWFVYQSSGFSAATTSYGLCFSVDYTLINDPTPSPSPTPQNDYKWDENADQWYWWNGTHWVISNGPTPTANTQLTTFTNNAISILFPLALIFGLALLGAWKAGFYGFMAGMTIGAVLGVLYLDLEIWVIVLIAIVDIIGIFAVKGRDKE